MNVEEKFKHDNNLIWIWIPFECKYHSLLHLYYIQCIAESFAQNEAAEAAFEATEAAFEAALDTQIIW